MQESRRAVRNRTYMQLLWIWRGADVSLCHPGPRVLLLTGTAYSALGSHEENDRTIWNFHPPSSLGSKLWSLPWLSHHTSNLSATLIHSTFKIYPQSNYFSSPYCSQYSVLLTPLPLCWNFVSCWNSEFLPETIFHLPDILPHRISFSADMIKTASAPVKTSVPFHNVELLMARNSNQATFLRPITPTACYACL